MAKNKTPDAKPKVAPTAAPAEATRVLDHLIAALHLVRVASVSPPSILRPQGGKSYPANMQTRVILEADNLNQPYAINVVHILPNLDGSFTVAATGHWPNNNDPNATQPIPNSSFDPSDLVFDQKFSIPLIAGEMYFLNLFKGSTNPATVRFTAV